MLSGAYRAGAGDRSRQPAQPPYWIAGGPIDIADIKRIHRAGRVLSSPADRSEPA
jgi:hypothetical protein